MLSGVARKNLICVTVQSDLFVSWAYYHHHYYQHAHDHQTFDEKHTIQRIAWLQSVAQPNTENSFISVLLINWEVGSPKSTFFLAISYVSGCCIGILG